MAEDVCSTDEPEIREICPGHFSACHFAEKLANGVDAAEPNDQPIVDKRLQPRAELDRLGGLHDSTSKSRAKKEV